MKDCKHCDNSYQYPDDVACCDGALADMYYERIQAAIKLLESYDNKSAKGAVLLTDDEYNALHDALRGTDSAGGGRDE